MKLYHYSKQPDLEVIDPAHFNTSGKGISPEYSQGTRGMLPRSYFYSKDEPEPIIAKDRHRYETKLPRNFKIYDLGEDPEGIAPHVQQTTGHKGADLYDAIEHEINNRGYHGYHNKKSRLAHALALFHPVKLYKTGDHENPDYNLDKSDKLDDVHWDDEESHEELVYVAMDGDNAGSQVERAAMRNDKDAIKDISERIRKGGEIIEKIVTAAGGEMVVFGGDDAGFYINKKLLHIVEKIRDAFFKTAGFTITAGVHPEIPKAVHALLYGKITGKNKVVFWTPIVEKKLSELKQDQTPEEKVSDLLDKDELEKGWKKQLATGVLGLASMAPMQAKSSASDFHDLVNQLPTAIRGIKSQSNFNPFQENGKHGKGQYNVKIGNFSIEGNYNSTGSGTNHEAKITGPHENTWADNDNEHYDTAKKIHKVLTHGVGQKILDKDELEKGSRQSKIGTNEDNRIVRTLTNKWQERADKHIRNVLPRLEGSSRERGLQKLTAVTKTRRNPRSNEVEFLLHRGVSNKEAKTAGNKRSTSSWTPHYHVASEFASERAGQGGSDFFPENLQSRWIPEKHIHHIPIMNTDLTQHNTYKPDPRSPIGRAHPLSYDSSKRRNPNFREEFEVIVAPYGKSTTHATPEEIEDPEIMSDPTIVNNPDQAINTRARNKITDRKTLNRVIGEKLQTRRQKKT